MKADAGIVIEHAPLHALGSPVPVYAVCAAVAGILIAYWSTAASIVSIWIRSETFAHGFLVIPICLWLVWRRRRELAQVPATPWWPGLGLVLAGGALWFVMSAADVLGLKQFALVFMIQSAIVTIVGLQAGRLLMFPLAFLLFAVPVGELFVPTLIDWTADFTVLALRWSGVPVLKEANHFVIPSGAWSVVEACSGIRYLIASVMVGTIYAAVAYRSPRRRIGFLVASILVPIVANWLRAYIIVMIGHLSGNKFAQGVDHIIYGWVFFGAVMLLLFWIGSFWQESDAAASPAAAPRAIQSFRLAASAPPRVLYVAAVAALILAAVWRPFGLLAQNVAPAGVPVLEVPQGQAGWQSSAEKIAPWKPHYHGFASDSQQTFHRGDRDVGLYLAYYRHQEKGRELITSGNLLTPREDFQWKQTGAGNTSLPWLGELTNANRAEISGPSLRLDVARLYWINGRVTGSEYVAKGLIAWSKLTGNGDDSALIVMYTPKRNATDVTAAVLQQFSDSMSPAIEKALAATRGDRP